MAKEINTVQQDAFLNCLFDPDIRGDIRRAMKKAGYSDTTATSEVVGRLKEQIIDRAKTFLALNAGKAAYSITDVLDSPNQMGAANALKAATEVLDRVGVIKQDNSLNNLPKGSIILLPPKREAIPLADYTVISEADIQADMD